MSVEWEQVVVDAVQPAALGRWWANALGWVVTFEADDEYEIKRPEVDRLLALGAHLVDVGQGEQPWVVPADPEGNEFCVLATRGVSSADPQFL